MLEDVGAEPPSVPDVYVTRPGRWSAAEAEVFERLFDAHVATASVGDEIDYGLDVAKWKFLCWLAEERGLLLHGSNVAALQALAPRRPRDPSEFGGQRAVFASSDGVWALFYAVLDRSVVTSMLNGCFWRRLDGEDRFSYFFSIDCDALRSGAWRSGTVYVVARDTFVREAPAQGEDPDGEHQWASTAAVSPLASLRVEPHDFPLLGEVRGHDVATVAARVERDPQGFPWLDGPD